jgi:hypothetical protein
MQESKGREAKAVERLVEEPECPREKIACREELPEADPGRSAAIPLRSIAFPLNLTETP